MRRLSAITAFCLLCFSPAAMAAPSGVFLMIQSEWNVDKLDDAIHATFGKAGIKLLPAAAPSALIAAIPDGLIRSNRIAEYQFAVSFYWQGAKLADAVESCPVDKPQVCADQFASDVQAAMAASN